MAKMVVMTVVMLVIGSVVLDGGVGKILGAPGPPLLLREMTDETPKAPESLKWPPPPKTVPETQSSEEGAEGNLWGN